MLKLVSKGMIEWTQRKSRLGDTSGYLVGSWMFLISEWKDICTYNWLYEPERRIKWMV